MPRHAQDAMVTPGVLPYVPRLALERALAELSELVGKTPACAFLSSETGLGKTRLLHVLQERLSGAFECCYLASAPDIASFWSEVASAIGLGSGDDDRGAVLGRARSLHGDGSGLVLLVDDVGPEAAELAAELAAVAETPGLSIVLALRGPGWSLPDPFRYIEIGPPLSAAETRAYVQARLRYLDPSGKLAARLSAPRLAEMHEAAAGLPARLDALIEAWRISGAVAAPPEPPLAQLRATARERQPARGIAAGVALAANFRRQLERPPVQLALSVLFVLLIGGFWYFALERSGGGASIGVPVDQYRAPAAPLAPVAEPDPHEPLSPAPAAPPSTEPASATPAATRAEETPLAQARARLRTLIAALLDRA